VLVQNTLKTESARIVKLISPIVIHVTQLAVKVALMVNLLPATENHVSPLVALQNMIAMENVLLVQLISLIATNVIKLLV